MKSNENGEKFNNLSIIEKVINEKDNSIEIYYKNNVVFEYVGLYKKVNLDEKNMAIITKDTNDFITFISTTNDEPIISSFKIWEGTNISYSEDLAKIKKMIIPYGGKYVVYSYEYGIITSAMYDNIQYQNDYFSIEYNIHLNDSLIKLEGTLNQDGHLIDDTLFVKELNTYILVDEHNLYESIMAELPKLKRKLVINSILKRKK